MRYAWAVHELPADETATDPPPGRAVHLLAYRDAGHAVRWLELTPLAAAIVESPDAGRCAGSRRSEAPAQITAPPPRPLPRTSPGSSPNLGERGVVLGAKAD